MDAPHLPQESTRRTTVEDHPGLPENAMTRMRGLAGRYVWWKTRDEAMEFPDRVAAQVMNLGTFEDLTALAEAAGEDYLRGVLERSEAGQLDARSWHYWHYRLGLAEYGTRPVPAMPVRKIA